MNCITNARTMWMNAAVTISLETDERSESQALLYGLVHEHSENAPLWDLMFSSVHETNRWTTKNHMSTTPWSPHTAVSWH